MSKILTISVAAYNVEAFIRENIESMLINEIIDDLEIIIVDDGGKDNTLSIAKEYQALYPNSIKAIHKENGGYGSTVNYSVSIATGKYFKLLDGDDWFDNKGLVRLVNELKKEDADVVVTDFFKGPQKDDLVIEKAKTIEPNKIIILKDISRSCEGFGMWALAFKTSILKECGLKLPEHRLYTDQIFCTVPFSCVKTIKYLPFGTYCYRVDRNGQSVSKESRIKHIQDAFDNCVYLSSFLNDNLQNDNYAFLLGRIGKYYWFLFRTILLFPVCREAKDKLEEYDKKIYSINPEVVKRACAIKNTGRFLDLCRKTNYYGYWLAKLKINGFDNWY